ncbi:hypothetical protein STRTUCAR8_04958 [Streptomyces turgidiscabies Car8]|uniref:Uncharacterized protein n=1 Tax=Streptomyces turgidiscabies (strain Car8) TaxID=698760 RepID=L7FB42_STRT8|nr:hypothetical protein STRTUCAR8_04958 [Streptomyces turgidiscabies Car8]
MDPLRDRVNAVPAARPQTSSPGRTAAFRGTTIRRRQPPSG